MQARFEEAVRLAELAFIEELARLTSVDFSKLSARSFTMIGALGAAARMRWWMSAPGVPSLKKGATLLGDVLDVDHGDALNVGLPDDSLDVLENGFRVPQWKLATGEVIVLEIDHQQCLRHGWPLL